MGLYENFEERQARLIKEREEIKLKQSTLTSLLLQQQWIEKWDGKLPVYGTAPMLYKPVK